MSVSAWDLATVLVKAVVYASTFAAAGGVLFLSYSSDLISAASVSQIRQLIGAAIAVAISSSLIRIGVLAGSMSDAVAGMLDSTMLGMILGSGEGVAATMRILGLGMAALVLLVPRRLHGASLLGAALATTSFAWVGHAHAAGTDRFAVALLVIHLVCVAFWLGALGPLLLIVRDPDATRVGESAARFGRLAIVGVGTLILVGIALLSCLLGSVSELWTSDYGRGFVAKSGLVVGLLSLAALNKLKLTPRVRAGEARAVVGLARSIRFEIVIGGLILLATAAVTTLWGPATLE